MSNIPIWWDSFICIWFIFLIWSTYTYNTNTDDRLFIFLIFTICPGRYLYLDFIPTTFILPADYNMFVEEYRRHTAHNFKKLSEAIKVHALFVSFYKKNSNVTIKQPYLWSYNNGNKEIIIKEFCWKDKLYALWFSDKISLWNYFLPIFLLLISKVVCSIWTCGRTYPHL